MDGQLRGDVVRLAGNARQQFHDSRGYGRALDGNEIELSRVEAAHLLFRGDLETVGGHDFHDFFVSSVREGDRFALRFLVYSDLRERGFYLSPVRDGWPGSDDSDADNDVDFVVYARGTGPGDGDIAYRIRILGERQSVDSASLPGLTLAVVDEESELTYFDATCYEFDGGTRYDPPSSLTGTLLEDHVLCWDAPEHVYERGFYGQPLSARDMAVEGGLQLSLVEAASLAAEGVLTLDGEGDGDDGGNGADSDEQSERDAYDAIVERGRTVEGDRFDRRLRAYTALRAANVVPKTGFKFGADFRTYADVDSVSELNHSETLVRVLPAPHTFSPRDLALDVRLAGGVRKRMVFALTDPTDGIDWLSVVRLTP